MLLSVVLIAILASVHGSDDRIVGGVPAQITDVPWQVSLQLDPQGKGKFAHECGGTIISKNVILSAAHCFNGTRVAQWRARAGSTYSDRDGQLINAKRIYKHPSFNLDTLDYDIALVTLAKNLTLSSSVAIATLPTQGQTVAEGAAAFVTGWGALFEDGPSPTHLYEVNISIVNQQQCVNAYVGYNLVTPRMICAGIFGVGGKDACQGDSGGPMIVNNILHGVTSWGRGCAQANYPGVWARVAQFRNWIDSNM